MAGNAPTERPGLLRAVRLGRRHNLPSALSSFVGREQELSDLVGLLAATRLLTLTGAGGVGKTRLALRLAGEVLAAYADGVWLVDLAPLAHPAQVARGVANVLGIREGSTRPVADQLARALGQRRLLLLLDNCEHLTQACAQLAEQLLRACPELRLLATSREALGLVGETVWRVPSLSLPWPERLPPLDKLAEFEAIRLFEERAQAAAPGFALTERNAAAVAQLCYQLDGIPLALELAAARMRALRVEQVAARLGDRFRLLVGGSRVALPRHQTLLGTVTWSYELLSPAERVLFERLAVFASGWTLEAAEQVAASVEDLPETEILDLLVRLVDKSLVQTVEHGETIRYSLLATIRAFGAERLAASGEAAVRARHAAFYLALAEEAGPGIRGPQQRQWLERLEVEYDNLRAAARWFEADPARAGDGLRLAAALWEFWHVAGRLDEGSRWLEAALAADTAPLTARGEALNGLGVLLGLRGDLGRALTMFVQSAEAFRGVGDRAGEAHALSNYANTVLMSGDPPQAVAIARRAVALAATDHAGWAGAYTHYALGWAARYSGDLELGLREASLAVAGFGAAGDRRGQAFAQHQLGDLLLGAGRPAQAVPSLREGLAGFAPLGDTWGVVSILTHLACAEALLGEVTLAARLVGAAEALRDRIGAELLPPFQQVLDRGAEVARTRLGEAAFVAATAAGRARPLEDTIAELLSARPAPASAGRGVLSLREQEVAALIAEGLTNRQIAERLVIAERTADTHVQHILAKLGFASRAQVAVWATNQERGAGGPRES